MCNARCIKTKPTWGEASEALERALKRQRTTNTATTCNNTSSTNVVANKKATDTSSFTSSCEPTTRTTMGLLELFDAIEPDQSPFPSILWAFDDDESDDSSWDTSKMIGMKRTSTSVRAISPGCCGTGMVRSKSIKTDLFSLSSSSYDLESQGTFIHKPIVNTFDILTQASEISEMDDLFAFGPEMVLDRPLITTNPRGRNEM